VPIVSLLAGLSAVADGGRIADPEQAGEPERVAAAGAGFIEQPVGAQLLRGDACPESVVECSTGEGSKARPVSGAAGLLNSTRWTFSVANSDRIVDRVSSRVAPGSGATP
jgi:hypothetical protein